MRQIHLIPPICTLSMCLFCSASAKAQEPQTASAPIIRSYVSSPLVREPHDEFGDFWYRFGIKLGIATPTQHIQNAPNQPFSNDSGPQFLVNITYRLQPAGTRTVFQPEFYVDLGGNAESKDDYDNNYQNQHEGHSYGGLGFAERASLNLNRRSAVYVGAGGGVYVVRSFHLMRELTIPSDNTYGDPYDNAHYDDFPDDYRTKIGWKLTAGLQFHQGLVTEVFLQDLGRSDNFSYRSAGLMVGYRR